MALDGSGALGRLRVCVGGAFLRGAEPPRNIHSSALVFAGRLPNALADGFGHPARGSRTCRAASGGLAATRRPWLVRRGAGFSGGSGRPQRRFDSERDSVGKRTFLVGSGPRLESPFGEARTFDLSNFVQNRAPLAKKVADKSQTFLHRGHHIEPLDRGKEPLPNQMTYRCASESERHRRPTSREASRSTLRRGRGREGADPRRTEPGLAPSQFARLWAPDQNQASSSSARALSRTCQCRSTAGSCFFAP